MVGSTESPARISDVSETPFQNLKKNVSDSSKTRALKAQTTLNSNTCRESENSIKKPFSSFLKRKSQEDIGNSSDPENDFVQNSPPRQQSKKAKLIFQKCFQNTIDPASLAGNILEEDSGDEG